MNIMEIIKEYKPQELFSKIFMEKPETIARVLILMEYQKRPDVFAKFALQAQIDILTCIAKMEEISPVELAQIHGLLAGDTAPVYENGIVEGGIHAVVELLNLSHRDIFWKIVASLEVANPQFADEIRKLMFVFEDIVMLSDDFLKTILPSVDDHDLAIALKGVDDEIQKWVFRKMTEEREKTIRNEMQEIGPMRKDDVKEVQYKIYKHFYKSR